MARLEDNPGDAAARHLQGDGGRLYAGHHGSQTRGAQQSGEAVQDGTGQRRREERPMIRPYWTLLDSEGFR